LRKKRKALVKNNLLGISNVEKSLVDPIQIGSRAWYEWLTEHDGFIYEGDTGHFTARLEMRRGINYWYGYRRRDGKLSKVYLGKSEDLTSECLEQASARLAGQIPIEQLLSDGNPVQVKEKNPAGEKVTDISSLPLTKVRGPALPQNLIPRPHLIQRINTPVTLICAPSGFGKSTLLNEWRENCDMQVAWVTLDEEDNNPLRFWSVVVAALQTFIPSVGQSWISQLYTSNPSNLSKIIINLTNDIILVTEEVNTSQRIGLVLDNYHHIQNPKIHDSLQMFFGHMSPKLDLIITSQARTPLDLGSLRSKGMVLELGIDDLRFSLDEGIGYLSNHPVGKHPAYEDMQRLVKRTEGWITGLVLATSALAQEETQARVSEVFTGAHPFLREFFTQNVLKQQTQEMQEFLLKTSILEHLSGPLCDAVTGNNDSADRLDQLWADRLFLERLEEPGWYRYHGLFIEMLQSILEEQIPVEIPDLHRRAANWYITNNTQADAIDHLLASIAWGEAADLMESIALRELEKFGEGPRLLRWLQQLPESVLNQHKTILVLYIRLVMLSLPPTEVEKILTRTEARLASTASLEIPDEARETLSEIHQIHRLWLTNNKPSLKINTSEEYKFVYQMMDDILPFNRDYTQDLIQAEARATAVYETAQARNHLYIILIAGGTCANLAFSQGYLRQSEQIAHQVLQQAFSLRGKFPEPASIALMALSGVYYERNQIAQAHQLMVRATEVNPNPTGMYEPVMIAILRAKIQSAQGDNEAAFATIQAIRELHTRRPSDIWLDQDLAAYQALFRLQQGDLVSAERKLSEPGKIKTHGFSDLVRAAILIEQNRNKASEDILHHLLDRYPHGFYWLPILRARVLLSIALFSQHKVNKAKQVIAEAARLAAPEFFIRPFLVSGPKITTLLSLILHTENLNEGTRTFLKGTLTQLGYADGIQSILPINQTEALTIAASITPREQQILRFLNANLSNQEIAELCSISSSTVKTHLENIYRKLEVNSRMQALEQARMLNLV